MRSAGSTKLAISIALFLGALIFFVVSAEAQDHPAPAQNGAPTASDGSGPAPTPSEPCADLEAAARAAAVPTLLASGGIQGMWFAMPAARLILCQIRDLQLRHRASLLDARERELWQRRVEIQSERAQAAIEARNDLRTVIQAAQDRAKAAEEALSSWTRSPVLWFAVGVIATVLVAGVGAVLLAELHP